MAHAPLTASQLGALVSSAALLGACAGASGSPERGGCPDESRPVEPPAVLATSPGAPTLHSRWVDAGSASPPASAELDARENRRLVADPAPGEGTQHTVELSDGEAGWRVTLAGYAVSGVLLDDGAAIVAGTDVVQRVEADGSIRWSFETSTPFELVRGGPGEVLFSAASAPEQPVLYAGDTFARDANLVIGSIAPDSGLLAWRIEVSRHFAARVSELRRDTAGKLFVALDSSPALWHPHCPLPGPWHAELRQP